MKKTTEAVNQMEEDDFLMECAMAQEIDILDQEQQQYEAQIMEQQMRKQDYSETECDYPTEILMNQRPPPRPPHTNSYWNQN